MPKKPNPKCVTLLPWLRSNLGSHALAPLTGTDSRALAAAVQTIELYSYCPQAGVIKAFGEIVRTMQPGTYQLAYHAIAHVMDWHDRTPIWFEAGLPAKFPRQICRYEPGGAKRPMPPR